jgi:hypothetical protein
MIGLYVEPLAEGEKQGYHYSSTWFTSAHWPAGTQVLCLWCFYNLTLRPHNKFIDNPHLHLDNISIRSGSWEHEQCFEWQLGTWTVFRVAAGNMNSVTSGSWEHEQSFFRQFLSFRPGFLNVFFCYRRWNVLLCNFILYRSLLSVPCTTVL